MRGVLRNTFRARSYQIEDFNVRRTDLVVPLLERQRMGDGKPIAVNLEVSRLTAIGKRLASKGELWTKTYYAGKSSIFRVVATTAHCAIGGYEPAMVETSAMAYLCKQSLRAASAKDREDYREEKTWHEVSRRNLNPKQGAARPAYVRSTSGGIRGPLEAVDTLPFLVEKADGSFGRRCQARHRRVPCEHSALHRTISFCCINSPRNQVLYYCRCRWFHGCQHC